MRKQTFNIAKLLVFILVATFASCSEEMDSVEYPEFTSSHLRSYSEAIEIAQRGISMLEGNSGTRSENGTRRKIDMNGFKCVTSKPTRSGDVDTLLYVVNFEDNQGYAIVSARRDVEGLLAVTESGTYDPLHKSENEGLNMFMDLASGYEFGPLIPIPGPEPTVVYHYCGPYITVRWGQRWPEGYFCLNGKSGCTITAMAQILSYFAYPTGIDLTYPDADLTYQALDWNSIKKHVYGTSAINCDNHINSICSASNDSHMTLARLCRQLGKLAHTYYDNQGNPSNWGSYTYDDDARDALVELGYIVNDSLTYSGQEIRHDLNNHHLILMCGGDSINNGNNNEYIDHSWVIDGYCHKEILMPMGIDGELIQTEQYYYNHINWGWNGLDNGYFLDGVWDVSQYESLDSLSTHQQYNFHKNLRYMNVKRSI